MTTATNIPTGATITTRKRLGNAGSSSNNRRSRKTWTSVLVITAVVLFGSLFLIYLFTLFALLWNMSSSTSTSNEQPKIEAGAVTNSGNLAKELAFALMPPKSGGQEGRTTNSNNNNNNAYNLRKKLEENMGVLPNEESGGKARNDADGRPLQPNQQNTTDSKQQQQKVYWRYDDANLMQISAENVKVHGKQSIPFLTCIPERYRLPASSTNVSNYFMDPHNVFPEREYLFDYNPSIVKIPPSMFSTTRPWSTTNDTTATKTTTSPSFAQYWKEKGAYFLASFRVSNKNYCFHPEDRRRMMGETEDAGLSSSSRGSKTAGGGGGGAKQSASAPMMAQDFLGLAVFTQTLELLSSVVVNVKVAGFPAAEDFRLFVLHGQLYVNSYDLLAPLWIWDAPVGAPPPITTTTTVPNHQQQQRHHHHKHGHLNYTVVPTVFGNENDDFNVWVGKQKSCASCSRANVCGKNLNFFEETTTTPLSSNAHSPPRVLAEIWPSPPHLIHSIDLSEACHRKNKPDHAFPSQESPIRSFATVDEALFPEIPHGDNRGVFTRGHGGACCVPLEKPLPVASSTGYHGRTILVGIQHTKTPWKKPRRHDSNSAIQANHYLSSFYAFEPTPPYHLIAQSGYFCLPFASSSSSSTDMDMNPLAKSIVDATAWRTLKLGNETFPRCPRIHFVSGMMLLDDDDNNQKYNNSKKKKGPDVLLSYGINDCYSQFVRISSQEILRLLFSGPNNNAGNSLRGGKFTKTKQ